MNNTNEGTFGSEDENCAAGNEGEGLSIFQAAALGAVVGLSHFYSQSHKQKKLEAKIRTSQMELNRGQDELKRSQVEHRINQVNELETLLEQRQDIYCSDFRFKESRFQLEGKIRNIVSKLQPQDFRSHVEDGIERIFREDHSCGSTLTYMMTGKPRNGGIMWQYLEQWKMMANKSD